jgi:hypothetical protein
MAKRRAYPAAFVVDMEGGFVKHTAPDPTQPQPHYGRKALVGQYTKRVVLVAPLDESRRISKGARARAERDHGTEVVRDFSESINSRRHK